MSGTPHLLVAPEKVVAVLLADGWHKIVSGSFPVGALGLSHNDDRGELGYCFEEIGTTSLDKSATLAGPLDAVLAVRQVTSRRPLRWQGAAGTAMVSERTRHGVSASVGTAQLTNPDHGAGWPASGVCHGVFHLDRDPRPERAVHRRAHPGLRQFPAHLAPDGRRAQVALRIRRVPRRSAGDIRARSGFAPIFPPVASAMCRHSASRAAYWAPPDRRRRPRDGRPGAGDPVTCTDM